MLLISNWSKFRTLGTSTPLEETLRGRTRSGRHAVFISSILQLAVWSTDGGGSLLRSKSPSQFAATPTPPKTRPASSRSSSASVQKKNMWLSYFLRGVTSARVSTLRTPNFQSMFAEKWIANLNCQFVTPTRFKFGFAWQNETDWVGVESMLALCILHLAHSGWRCRELFLGGCEDQREHWRVLWDLVLYTCHMTATELSYTWKNMKLLIEFGRPLNLAFTCFLPLAMQGSAHLSDRCREEALARQRWRASCQCQGAQAPLRSELGNQERRGCDRAHDSNCHCIVEFPFFGPKTQSGLAQLDVCVCVNFAM